MNLAVQLTELWQRREELGWLDLALELPDTIAAIQGKLVRLKKMWPTPWRQVVLVGMGGSSMAAEVVARTLSDPAMPKFLVMDSTHPTVLRSQLNHLELATTLFVIASKSGTTIETCTIFDHLHAQMTASQLSPNRHFVVITDPATPLIKLASQRQIESCFLAPAKVGGRFSALSVFGLVPAMLLGIDLRGLQASAKKMHQACQANRVESNPALALAQFLLTNHQAGRDQLLLQCTDAIWTLPAWIEQLVAESSGKDGKGLLPLCDATWLPTTSVGRGLPNLQVVNIGTARAVAPQGQAELPTHHLPLTVADLGGHFLLWEIAVALFCKAIGVNPFDQPQVELAKQKARILSSAPAPTLPRGLSLSELVQAAEAGDYLAILDYAPNPSSLEPIKIKLAAPFRARGVTVCHNRGPRYLHSTGQLHKGGSKQGLFIVIGPGKLPPELAIPEKPFGFGKLVQSQAGGDFAALHELNRRVAYLEPEQLGEALKSI